jgi:hypothetical protein
MILKLFGWLFASCGCFYHCSNLARRPNMWQPCTYARRRHELLIRQNQPVQTALSGSIALARPLFLRFPVHPGNGSVFQLFFSVAAANPCKLATLPGCGVRVLD